MQGAPKVFRPHGPKNCGRPHILQHCRTPHHSTYLSRVCSRVDLGTAPMTCAGIV